ncbi:uncharacterized protein LOC125777517 [Bactrocera dorsalis]|uniref:Uncharacterized protein LOC125777517 n=1 Tax=Bactrocera dorsalis TaxID=27457 RepID=A0ABM3JH78_BACDO|nr:uncharacterized protein LOC125777517 [Bactrocera dorsalis]
MATKPSPNNDSDTTKTPVGVSSGSRLGVTGAKPPATELTSCADGRSATLYKKAVSQVGKVWKGARLEAVAKEDLPLRPRARVWLPAEPSTPSEIEEILRYCNPSLPTQDWRVLRLERTDEPYRQALIMLNTESIGPLSKTKGAISYGFEMVVLKVLPSDARADGPQAPVAAGDLTKGTDGQTTVEIDATEGADGQTTVEVDPNLSDVASVGGGSSIGDSVFSLEQMFEEVRVDHDLGAEIALLEESLKDEFLQINLQHAKAASANLLLRLEQDGADVVLIQEPWLTGNGISGLRTKSHRLLAAKDAGRNRACMLVRNELTVFLLPNFSSADIVTAKLECDTGDFWLISAYMPHDDVVEPPPLLLRRTLAEVSKASTGVIIGSDANSRHQIWGSSDTNNREHTVRKNQPPAKQLSMNVK